MPTLLHIDSSPIYGRSVSRQLTGAFVSQWMASHPNGTVIDRDLYSTPIPPINAEWVGAVYTPEEARTPEQKQLLSLSDSLLAELEQADEYVFGVPMHNFGVPSVLKFWIDQISRVGKTFSYVEGKPKGLLIGKKATFVIATGGSLRRQHADGLLQFRRAVFALSLWLPRRNGCDLPYRRRNHGPELWEGSQCVPCTSPPGSADVRANYLRR